MKIVIVMIITSIEANFIHPNKHPIYTEQASKIGKLLVRTSVVIRSTNFLR
jgi:hypothetical protein